MKGNGLYFSGWLLLVAAGFGLGSTPPPAAQAGRVVRVVDGDTYDVLASRQVVRVRLAGADASELGRPFGAQAADSVARLLLGRPVRLVRRGADRYGRTVAAVRLAGAQRPALDSLLVVRGWAWAWDPRRRVAGRAAEQVAAQRVGRGLWQCGPALPPQLWRSLDARNKRRYWVSCPR